MKTDSLKVVYNHRTGFEIHKIETTTQPLSWEINFIQYLKMSFQKLYKGLEELGSGAGYSMRH